MTGHLSAARAGRFRASALGAGVAVGVAAIALAGCGSSGNSGDSNGGGGNAATGKGKVWIADIQPFSGDDAAFGPEQEAGCIPATKVVNDNGGVAGHTLDCKAVDSHGNPTEAVPAVQQMLATTGNSLAGVIGPSSDEVAAVIPLLDQAQVPYFPDTGDPRYNTQSSDYYWRITTSDDAGGRALAIAANDKGYKRIAIVAGNDPNSQTLLPSLRESFPKLGGSIVDTESIKNGESSYRSEASKVARANPDAIVLPTTDPQTVATFLGEFSQLHPMVPILGQVPALQPKFSGAIAGAIGRPAYEQNYYSVHPFSPTSGPAYEVYKKALLASSARVDKPKQWVQDPYSLGPFDAVTIMSLAMLSANSTDPKQYNSHILDVTKAGGGKTVVHTFADGKKALAAGKQIQYVGALGQIAFTDSHNSSSSFLVTQAKGDKEQQVANVTAAEIAKVG